MSIQLGNLELKNIVEEEYLNQIQDFLNNNGFKRESTCDKIENEIGNYHIFDIPKLMIICGEEKLQEFIKFLQDNNLVGNAFKGSVGLTYE